jgi:prepilin-type N-terminal cleavage/methylation domain-containing protein
MKKGFSLVEMLTVIVILTAIAIPLSRLYKLATYDIPKSFRLVETNTSILDILRYLKKDVNSAAGFPQSFGKYVSGDKCLLIENKNNVICYLLEDEKVTRVKLSKDFSKEGEVTWRIPAGKIEWQVWSRNGAGYAVEIRKHTELKNYNLVEKKMKNTYVYFVPVGQEAIN